MTKQDASPGIGTPESALRSCVTLIASVTGQPEALTEKYLDLYYQVRLAAEITDCHTSAAALVRNDGPERLEPKTGPSVTPSTAEAVSEAGNVAPRVSILPETRQAAGGGKGKKVDFDEVLASASAGVKMPPDGKQRYAPFGKVKAEILERYVGLRGKDMTIAQAVNLSGRKISEGQILTIMNGGKVPMAAYNALEDAMNKWEQVTAKEHAEAAVSQESTA